MEEKEVGCCSNQRIRLVAMDRDSGVNISGVAVEDRLSSLPEPLLVEILSLLPIRSAATTSVLSPRWRHIWTQVTRVRFAEYPVTTINHILRQLTSSKLYRFQVFLNWKNNWDVSHQVQEWVRQICARNPEEIELDMWSSDKNNVMDLPSCFSVCRSLVVVKFDMWCNIKLSDCENINMPMLKKLRVHVSDLNRESTGLWIKRCPGLEDLELITAFQSGWHLLDVCGPNLRRLTIQVQERSEGNRVLINTPKLEDLNVSGKGLFCLDFKFSWNFPGKLHKAEISPGFDNSHSSDKDDYKKALELAQRVSSVTYLDINGILLHCLCHPCDAVLPIFSHLTHLSIDLDSFTDHETNAWSDILRFISRCPNLEVLVINMEDYVAEEGEWIAPECVPPCFINKLGKIEIKNLNYEGRDDELIFLEYVLCNANVLERLLVSIGHANIEHIDMGRHIEDIIDQGGVDELGEGRDFCEDLFSYQRSSLTCEIEVLNEWFSASSETSEEGFRFIPNPSPPSRLHPGFPDYVIEHLVDNGYYEEYEE